MEHTIRKERDGVEYNITGKERLTSSSQDRVESRSQDFRKINQEFQFPYNL